jgi:hypothetical protein
MPEDMAEAERHARVLTNSAKEELDPSSRRPRRLCAEAAQSHASADLSEGQEGCHEIFSD